jgi:hypothetical protein
MKLVECERIGYSHESPNRRIDLAHGDAQQMLFRDTGRSRPLESRWHDAERFVRSLWYGGPHAMGFNSRAHRLLKPLRRRWGRSRERHAQPNPGMREHVHQGVDRKEPNFPPHKIADPRLRDT